MSRLFTAIGDGFITIDAGVVTGLVTLNTTPAANVEGLGRITVSPSAVLFGVPAGQIQLGRTGARGVEAICIGNSIGGTDNGYTIGIGHETFYYCQIALVTFGYANIGIGDGAMYNVSGAVNSIGIGYQAGYGPAAAQNSINNVDIGYQAGYSIASGSSNVNLGRLVGQNITSGTNNICAGDSAGQNITAESYNIAFGANCSTDVGASDGIVFGGNASAGTDCIGFGRFVTAPRGAAPRGTISFKIGAGVGDEGKTFMLNIYTNNLGATTPNVHVVSAAGELGINTSSARFKENIRDSTDDDTKFIYDLQVRQFDRKDGSNVNECGLIAEELNEVKPALVIRDSEGQILTYNRDTLVPYVLRQMQLKNNEINQLIEDDRMMRVQADNLRARMIEALTQLTALEVA